MPPSQLRADAKELKGVGFEVHAAAKKQKVPELALFLLKSALNHISQIDKVIWIVRGNFFL